MAQVNTQQTETHNAFFFKYHHINIYIYTVTTFKYVEGGPDREAPEVV